MEKLEDTNDSLPSFLLDLALSSAFLSLPLPLSLFLHSLLCLSLESPPLPPILFYLHLNTYVVSVLYFECRAS